MTATSCPRCGKPVDALRARHVAVRDGRVQAFCSAACARDPATTAAVAAAAVAAAPAVVVVAPAAAARVPVAAPAASSGVVVEEIVREPGSAPVTARDLRSATQAFDWIDDEPAGGAAVAEAPGARRGRGRGPLVGLAIAAVAIAGGFGIYRATRASDAPAEAPAPALAPVSAPDASEPPARVAPAAHLEQALATLRTHLASTSPRVAQRAAAALARTGDAAAIAALVIALPTAQPAATRLELAYALARGGDDRGRAALVAGLRAARRDDKLEAARHLARLADPAAAPVLAGYLGVAQHRLSAAEALAPLADPRALRLLAEVRADPATSADDRARAAIALGDATALRELLADPRFNAYAAVALAELHDPAARPVLEAQLAISALRVAAARGLRRLDPAAPPPDLAPLAAGLAAGDDLEQLSNAEALLLLAGPPAWAARP